MLKHRLRLLEPVAAQLGHQHSWQRERAASAGLGFLLPATRLGLLNAGDDRELAGVEIDRPPPQRRDLAPSHSAEHGKNDKDFLMSPRRSSKKDSPAKLAGRMKRRWRVVLLRSKGEILGEVEAPDAASGESCRSGPV